MTPTPAATSPCLPEPLRGLERDVRREARALGGREQRVRALARVALDPRLVAQVCERQRLLRRRADARAAARRSADRPSAARRRRPRHRELAGRRDDREVELPGGERRERGGRAPARRAGARRRAARRGTRRSRAGSASRWPNGNAPMRRRPRVPSASAASWDSAVASRSRIASACSTSSSPAGVSRMPRAERSTSWVPASASSVAIWREIGGLGEGERLGGGGEGAAGGDLAQDPQAADVKHDQIVWHLARKIICGYGWAPGAWRSCRCIPTSPLERPRASRPQPRAGLPQPRRPRRRRLPGLRRRRRVSAAASSG